MQRYRLEYSEGIPPNIKLGIDFFVKESDVSSRLAILEEALRNLMRSYESIVRGEMGGFNEAAYPEWEQARAAMESPK